MSGHATGAAHNPEDKHPGGDEGALATAAPEASGKPSQNAGAKRRGKRKAHDSRGDVYKYKYSNHLKEDHGKPIFGVRFNQYEAYRARPRHLFATVGSNRVTVYECLDAGGIHVLQAYVDECEDESFYSCAWGYDPSTTDPILAVAGSRGIIRTLRPAEHRHYQTFTGHGHAINELQFHPKDPNLLLSVSKDHSLRLWNIKSSVCVVMFGGEKGHRDEVLSADFNLEGNRLISCGMDHSLKVWSLDTHQVVDAIKRSQDWVSSKSQARVHRNYVDCVRWFGDLVLSKSTENNIICWKPGGQLRLDLDEKRLAFLGDPVTIIKKFEYYNCDIWYVRFAMDPLHQAVAIGNQRGKVFVYDLGTKCRTLLEHKKCTTTVRQTCFSYDSSILVSVCDDGTVWRWDRT